MFARKCQPFPSSQQEIKSQPKFVNDNVDNMKETNESDNCLKNKIDIVGKMQRIKRQRKCAGQLVTILILNSISQTVSIHYNKYKLNLNKNHF